MSQISQHYPYSTFICVATHSISPRHLVQTGFFPFPGYNFDTVTHNWCQIINTGETAPEIKTIIKENLHASTPHWPWCTITLVKGFWFSIRKSHLQGLPVSLHPLLNAVPNACVHPIPQVIPCFKFCPQFSSYSSTQKNLVSLFLLWTMVYMLFFFTSLVSIPSAEEWYSKDAQWLSKG